MLKKCIQKYGTVITAFAFVIATYSANTACNYIFHQPKLPESVKSLRKF